VKAITVEDVEALVELLGEMKSDLSLAVAVDSLVRMRAKAHLVETAARREGDGSDDVLRYHEGDIASLLMLEADEIAAAEYPRRDMHSNAYRLGIDAARAVVARRGGGR